MIAIPKDKYNTMTPEQRREYDELCAKLTVEKKEKKKRVKVTITNREWLSKCYYAAREKGFANNYPEATKSGHYYKNDMPDVGDTNGTTRYIIDCMCNLGHFAERVNTGGVYRNGTYTYAASTKGSSDIHIILQGNISWKVEVKKGADVLSKAQERYRDKILAVGGLHSVVYVGQLAFFWEEYKRVIKK